MLKATGRVYELGENVGMSGKAVFDIDTLIDAIKSSTVPLVKTFEGMSDPENVIGHADLEIRDGSLWANVTFNQQSEKDYWDAFCNGYSPKLGFYAAQVDIGDAPVSGALREVKSMSIRSVALNETCLGGPLENIKKE